MKTKLLMTAVISNIGIHECFGAVGLNSLANLLAQKYMPGKPSAILSFDSEDSYDADVRFYDALKIFKRLVHLGDAKPLACHPASTNHRQLTEKEQKQAEGFSRNDSFICGD